MLTLPKCELCARYKDDGKHETCEAFPDGIPEDVLWEPVEKECNNGMKFIKEQYNSRGISVQTLCESCYSLRIELHRKRVQRPVAQLGMRYSGEQL